MWCPEGYVTLDQARGKALIIGVDLVHSQYDGGDTVELFGYEFPRMPDGASKMTQAVAIWILDEWLNRGGWGVSTPDGNVVNVTMRRLLDVADRSGQPQEYYNPITSIGPPTPEWLEYHDRHYYQQFKLIDFDTGLVRSAFPLSHFRFWQSAILAKLFWGFGIDVGHDHVMRAIVWKQSLALAWKLRGRAVCVKAADLEAWQSETVDYLKAFLGNCGKEYSPEASACSALPQVEPDRPAKGAPGRRPKQREQIAAAILDLYGPIREPVTSYKEAARAISVHTGKTVALSTLRRAFDALRDE